MLKDFLEVDGDPVPLAAYLDAITHTHERRIQVRVLDLNHNRKASIDTVIDGQMTMDTDNEESTRVANVTLLDPTKSIGWEPDSPSSLPIHQRRMVQVLDWRAVRGYGWVGCPVFTGPVDEFDRNGAEVFITALGKDHLARGSFGRTHSWPKNTLIVEVIRDIMMLAGEVPSRIHLPALNARLPKAFNVDRNDKPLVKARKLAADLNCIAFYNGRGHFIVRRRPTEPSLTLDEDWLRSEVRIDRPRLIVKNRWVILGPKPGGNKARPFADVWLPRPNAFSAWSVGRDVGGERVPRWLIHEEERATKVKAKLLEIANRKRDTKIRFAADVTVDTLPFPMVEEYDLYRAKDPVVGTVVTQARKVTFPFVEGDQTIGALRKVSRMPRHRGYQPATTGGLR